MYDTARLLCLLVIWALPLGTRESHAAERPPNIVFILADDVGKEVLGCYGGETYHTPRLDELAESGLTFDHCYSMPVCHPSRISVLTGKYPFQLGNPRWGTFPVAMESQTLAQQLGAAGYKTAISGKWQLTLLGDDLHHPNRLGFDSYCLFGWHQGPRYFDPMIFQDGILRQGTKGSYGPDLYVDYLLDFFEENRDRPFFAFYSMSLCHDVTDDLDEPVPHGPANRYENYVEMVASMDAHVGRIVDGLEELSLRHNTLILFSTDNGTPKTFISRAVGKTLERIPVVSRQGGRDVPGGKGQLTDGGTAVPTIASWPRVVPPGATTSALVDFCDLLPTFVELAGAKVVDPAGESRGRSFASVLHAPKNRGRDWVFAEGRGRYWLRNAAWKLYSDGTFFDMETDPLEQSPINLESLGKKGRRNHAFLMRATRDLMGEP